MVLAPEAFIRGSYEFEVPVFDCAFWESKQKHDMEVELYWIFSFKLIYWLCLFIS